MFVAISHNILPANINVRRIELFTSQEAFSNNAV